MKNLPARGDVGLTVVGRGININNPSSSPQSADTTQYITVGHPEDVNWPHGAATSCWRTATESQGRSHVSDSIFCARPLGANQQSLRLCHRVTSTKTKIRLKSKFKKLSEGNGGTLQTVCAVTDRAMTRPCVIDM